MSNQRISTLNRLLSPGVVTRAQDQGKAHPAGDALPGTFPLGQALQVGGASYRQSRQKKAPEGILKLMLGTHAGI